MRIIFLLLLITSSIITTILGIGSGLAIADVINEGENSTVGFFLFIPTTALFAYITILIKKKLSSITNKEIDTYIFKFAVSNNGLVTATELASDGILPIEKARKSLERIHIQGLCEKRITNNFINVYGFTEVLSQAEKQESTVVSSAQV